MTNLWPMNLVCMYITFPRSVISFPPSLPTTLLHLQTHMTGSRFINCEACMYALCAYCFSEQVSSSLLSLLLQPTAIHKPPNLASDIQTFIWDTFLGKLFHPLTFPFLTCRYLQTYRLSFRHLFGSHIWLIF